MVRYRLPTVKWLLSKKTEGVGEAAGEMDWPCTVVGLSVSAGVMEHCTGIPQNSENSTSTRRPRTPHHQAFIQVNETRISRDSRTLLFTANI